MIYIVCTVAGVALLVALLTLFGVAHLAKRVCDMESRIIIQQMTIRKQTELLGHMNDALEKAGA